ncbi:Uncharacterised protein [Janthinobacterium lividum]|uniref:hypothetical protein n=1 Tax=Janthinobacterium lividum TaxID=29581 RepID=UPI000DFD6447|nr:hypothetical protein [Janthinobacterium lividum]STQ92583.1 Uncharacterised protein [Janthinobacterium lividum]
MKTMLFILSLALAQPVLAQQASAKAPRQHPALVEFDTPGLDDMRAKVQAVINRPADLSPDKVAAFEKARIAAEGAMPPPSWNWRRCCMRARARRAMPTPVWRG